MNKNNLTKGLFTTLLLVSSVVSADEKYPAADFQPSVVYQSDAIKNGSSTQTAIKQAAPVVAQATHEVDSKYPAADFQPTVVYSDDKYQHNKTVPASASKHVSSASATEKSSVAPLDSKSEAPKEDSSLTYLLGLIGLAGAGIFLFKKQTPAAASTTKKASTAAASSKTAATTGVGKYINKVSGTGVSRYVEQQVKTAKSATGVAKYVAQQTLAEKARAAEEAEKKATGVEKYMRNRG
ncbi:MAG: hypothetical protein EXR80_06560 [Methylococcales bacterium]|nr:hypothetical protein [Methylococcales bacterium]